MQKTEQVKYTTLQEVFIDNKAYFQNDIKANIKVDENGEYAFNTSGLFELSYDKLAVHIKLLVFLWVWRALPTKIYPRRQSNKETQKGKRYEINLIYEKNVLGIENYSGFSKFLRTDEELLSSVLLKAYYHFWDYFILLSNNEETLLFLIKYIQVNFFVMKNYTIDDHVKAYIKRFNEYV